MEAAEDLFRLAHEGSDEARSRIIRENAGLVRMMAYRLGGGRADLEDLIQWGQIGLIQAVDRFDPSYGSRFSSFAVPYIAGEIRRCLRENRPVKCSREIGSLSASIRRFQQEFESQNARPPSLQEVCQSLHLTPENALLALNAAAPVSSLEEPLDSDEELCLGDTISQPQTGPHIEEKLDLALGIASLTEDERRLIQLRYYKNHTQQQTADCLGMTQVQVCRLEKRILKTLRERIG